MKTNNKTGLLAKLALGVGTVAAGVRSASAAAAVNAQVTELSDAVSQVDTAWATIATLAIGVTAFVILKRVFKRAV